MSKVLSLAAAIALAASAAAVAQTPTSTSTEPPAVRPESTTPVRPEPLDSAASGGSAQGRLREVASAAERSRRAPADSAGQLLAANALYLAGDFDAAAEAYAALADAGHGGATLHLNRGNALLRGGRRGPAIASYLRALRASPGDPDARENLALARAGNVDRLVGAASRPLHARVAERTPDAAAAAAFAVPWVLLWLALAARRLAPRRARFLLGAAALLLAAAAALGAALLAARDSELRRTVAVVVSPAAPVREAPEAALKPAFEVHEGTEVEVLEVRGDSARVRLVNGLEGWVEARALEAV